MAKKRKTFTDKLWEELEGKLTDMSKDEMQDFAAMMVQDIINSTPITVKDWQETHPGAISCASDTYYTKLVNRIKNELCENNLSALPQGAVDMIAISAATYLEDMVNDFGVWNAFRNLYRATYGTWLPFYDCDHDDYLLDNVNFEDIKFIVWQSFCRCGEEVETVYSPYSPGVERLAEIIYDILADEFEKAPESQRVASFINKALAGGDYYQIRNIATWINLDNPLTAVPGLRTRLLEDFDKDAKKHKIPKDLYKRLLYDLLARHSWRNATGPLGNATKLWIADMARQRDLDSLANKIENMTANPLMNYKILSVGKSGIELEGLYGNTYTLERNSMEKGIKLDGMKAYEASLINFDGQWLQDGMAIPRKEFTPSTTIVLTGLPETVKPKVDDIINRYEGQQAFVFKNTAQLQEFINTDLGFSLGEIDPDYNKIALLISRESMPTIIDGAARFIKLKGNRMYSAKDSEVDGLSLITENIADDVAKYLQDNNLCPDISLYTSQGGDLGHKIIRENFRYLCAFYRTTF